jgi:hypothetical protein
MRGRIRTVDTGDERIRAKAHRGKRGEHNQREAKDRTHYPGHSKSVKAI